MKKTFTPANILPLFVVALLISTNYLSGQCTNADFENGNLTGWSGTYCGSQCNTTIVGGFCPCYGNNPGDSTGFILGPNNDPPGDATNEWSEVITTTAGGNDPNLFSLGATLPMVWPGSGNYSMRLGSMWQSVETSANITGQGETMSYSFLVTPSNCNFTYYCAIVLEDGGHANGEQPFFSVGMTDSSGHAIDCAAYQVDGSTAQTIGGFNSIPAQAIYWRPWSATFVPLSAYIGQTVTITFTTRGCLPGGCVGSHYSYAYIDAECSSINNIAFSSPTVCNGQNTTLTAPAGAATYSWTGPGIVSGADSQVVTVNLAGLYTVTMTTSGNTPCTFSLDTVIGSTSGSADANFSATTACASNSTTFTDLSTPVGQIGSWAWDFTNSGTIQSTSQNPTYTFPSSGTYSVRLTIGTIGCGADTVIDVVVLPVPSSTFTATSPVSCQNSSASTITYTGSGTSNDIYTWNFDGADSILGNGQGPYIVSWNTPGVKNITLSVATNSCASSPTTVPVVVNPCPGDTTGDTTHLNPLEICIVSVDSATDKNIVIWNNPGSPAIDSVLVYKESSVLNVYDNIGGVAGTDFSTFIDTGSNPAQHADRYELIVLDSSGHLTAPCSPHQTIHLSVSPGTGTSWNLIWNPYVGFVFPTYYIYRADSSGIFVLIDSVSSANTSYTDLNAPTGAVYYQVRVVNPNGCSPSRSNNYSVSISNSAYTGLLGIAPIVSEPGGIVSYSMPGQTIIKVTGSFETYGLKLYDMTGRLVLDMPNRNTGETILPVYLAGGVYVVQAIFNTGAARNIKVVIN